MKESLERIQELLSDLTDALIRGEDRIGLVENYRTEIRDEALEEAAKLMEDKFHKVGRYPNYHPKYVPGDMHSPFADAIRTLALAAAASEEKGNG